MTISTTVQRALIILVLLQCAHSVVAIVLQRGITCNGHVELCGKGFGEVVQVGAHNSYAVGSANVAANQNFNVTQQLNDGVRLLQNQVHSQPGGLHLCHTVCPLYDAGLFTDYLTEVRQWMDANPNDVVTLLLVNIDNVPVTQLADAYSSAGLDQYVFTPKTPQLTIDQWPTLGNMIASKTRLVTFVDNGADPSQVPYIMDEFTNMWETAFDVTNEEWLCDVNRTRGDPTTKLYLINHFLDESINVLGAETIAPAKDKLSTTNAATGPGSIGFEVDNCVASHGVPPNVIMVDFYDAANAAVFDVAAKLNGVPAPTSKPPPPPSEPSASSAPDSIIVSTRPINAATRNVGSIGFVVGILAFGLLVV